MTAKRFMVDDAGTLIDMQTRDMFDIVEEVVDLLNEQHEQIQAQSIVIQGYQERCDEVFKENEELKSFNKDLSENLSACANARISKDDWIEKLKEENEQLKSLNQYLIELLRESGATVEIEEVKMNDYERFKVVDIEEELYPMPIYYDNNKELGYNEVCVLLNTLYNENEQLKKEIKEKEKVIKFYHRFNRGVDDDS